MRLCPVLEPPVRRAPWPNAPSPTAAPETASARNGPCHPRLRHRRTRNTRRYLRVAASSPRGSGPFSALNDRPPQSRAPWVSWRRLPWTTVSRVSAAKVRHIAFWRRHSGRVAISQENLIPLTRMQSALSAMRRDRRSRLRLDQASKKEHRAPGLQGINVWAFLREFNAQMHGTAAGEAECNYRCRRTRDVDSTLEVRCSSVHRRRTVGLRLSDSGDHAHTGAADHVVCTLSRCQRELGATDEGHPSAVASKHRSFYGVPRVERHGGQATGDRRRRVGAARHERYQCTSADRQTSGRPLYSVGRRRPGRRGRVGAFSGSGRRLVLE